MGLGGKCIGANIIFSVVMYRSVKLKKRCDVPGRTGGLICDGVWSSLSNRLMWQISVL
jgi:hypothetical protein